MANRILGKIDKALPRWCPLPAREVRWRLRNRVGCVLQLGRYRRMNSRQAEKHFRRRVPGVSEEVKERP